MTDMITHVLAYINDGWAITPLHWIDPITGHCSCGNPKNDPEHDYRHGGKHPITPEWQKRPILTADEAVVAWTRHPMANIGGLTGHQSNRWVLDEDPDNGANMSALLGTLPRTRVHRTGSGGRHFIFNTKHGVPITNSPGMLPLGWDVRGTGGQIVLPPSTSGKGAYAVLHDDPAVDPPDWLVATIHTKRRAPAKKRPPQCRNPQPIDYEMEGTLERPVVTRVGVPALFTNPGSNIEENRQRAYAERVLGDELPALAGAPVGTRNQTAFRVAARIHELINAKFIDSASARLQFIGACRAMDTAGNRFGEDEAEGVWASAGHHVGVTAAILPPDTFGGDEVAGPPGGYLPGLTAIQEPGPAFEHPGDYHLPAPPRAAPGPEVLADPESGGRFQP